MSHFRLLEPSELHLLRSGPPSPTRERRHHILYSPKGQTLYRSSGYLNEGQIREIPEHYMKELNSWTERGEVSPWMRFRDPVHPKS